MTVSLYQQGVTGPAANMVLKSEHYSDVLGAEQSAHTG